MIKYYNVLYYVLLLSNTVFWRTLGLRSQVSRSIDSSTFYSTCVTSKSKCELGTVSTSLFPGVPLNVIIPLSTTRS